MIEPIPIETVKVTFHVRTLSWEIPTKDGKYFVITQEAFENTESNHLAAAISLATGYKFDRHMLNTMRKYNYYVSDLDSLILPIIPNVPVAIFDGVEE